MIGPQPTPLAPPNPNLPMEVTCPRCKGRTLAERYCSECRGTGKVWAVRGKRGKLERAKEAGG